MLLRIGFDIAFDFPAPAAVLAVLYVHPSRMGDLRGSDAVHADHGVLVREFTDGFGNRAGRLLAPAGPLRLTSDCLIADSGRHEPGIEGFGDTPVDALPDDVLPFLLSSRYCEVDLLSETAWSLFGDQPAGWKRVHAVVEWVHRAVQFGYEFANKTRTAVSVLEEKRGVCRDFQHLAVTFCRCLGVPARYATGYLGDIGVPLSPNPMDFSAWFEVFLEGRWRTLDARNYEPRIGRILMARGRDAADVALTTTFGVADLMGFQVWTDVVEE